MIYMEIDKNLAWVLGFCVGDGCVSKSKGKYTTYSVCFVNSEECLIKKVNKILTPFVGGGNLKKKKNIWRAYWAKDGYFFFNKFGSFHSHNWKVPSIILGSNESIKSSFLQGYFDADGHVSFSEKHHWRTLRIDSINLLGLKQINKFLKEFDIYFNLHRVKHSKGHYGHRSLYALITGKWDSILNFYKRVGFSSPKKSQILKDMIINYRPIRRYWKEKEIDFLKNNYGKMELKKICFILGRSSQSIKMEAFKLDLKYWRRKKIPKEKLEDLYWNKGLTSNEIGNIFGLTHKAILYKMEKFGIKRRRGGKRK